uniref:Ground-like domain-containing protein n=1 Tax=Plectus sambesii TaxID=2011161 RepID=A0A914V957_9BILA
MYRLVILLMAAAIVTGTVDRRRLHDDPGYTGDNGEVVNTAPAVSDGDAAGAVAAVPAVPAAPAVSEAPEAPAAPEGPDASAAPAAPEAPEASAAPAAPEAPEASAAPEVPEAPVGSSDGHNPEAENPEEPAAGAAPADGEGDNAELKVERTQWGPNVGTGENGELINPGTGVAPVRPVPGVTPVRPGQTGPIPGCYINDSGYMCCNNELEQILLGAQDELRKLDPGKSDCNTLRQAKHIQSAAQRYFGTDFETIVALDDFAFRTNFLGNMTCKVEVNGKFMLAYATPDKTKVDKFPIYQPTTPPNPYAPPPPPLRPDYGAPPPPPPSNYPPPPPQPQPSQSYSQLQPGWN